MSDILRKVVDCSSNINFKALGEWGYKTYLEEGSESEHFVNLGWC